MEKKSLPVASKRAEAVKLNVMGIVSANVQVAFVAVMITVMTLSLACAIIATLADKYRTEMSNHFSCFGRKGFLSNLIGVCFMH